MTESNKQPSFVKADGSHFERHGVDVFQADATYTSEEDRATAATVTVYSYRNIKRGPEAVVMVSVTRNPLRMDLELTTESAVLLIGNLKAAVRRVHEVDAVVAHGDGAATMAHQMLFAPPTCRECGGAA